MNRIDHATEQRLWSASGVRAIAELPGYPFPDHTSMVEAVRTGAGKVGIEYDAARNLINITEPKAVYYLIGFLMWVPFLLPVASLLWAFYRRDWVAAGGLVSAPLALVFVSPFNPLRKPIFRVSLVLVFGVWLLDDPFGGIRWVALCFAVSILALSYVNSFAWNSAESAAMQSEAFAAYLFKTRNLHIWDSSGRVHSAPKKESVRSPDATSEVQRDA